MPFIFGLCLYTCCLYQPAGICRLHQLFFKAAVRYANVGTDYLTVSVPLLPYCFRSTATLLFSSHCYLTVSVPRLPCRFP
ncbi:hypothetical protein [Methanimicrococcus hacksteinii]|uniref:hypothetical protein n=1 Tax=Methanimicrococcus hacksteinii TaxID=3028293 RepID=UPI00298F1B65|nr:hypothetical protein [Methanimicrococcus sp. At1]